MGFVANEKKNLWPYCVAVRPPQKYKCIYTYISKSIYKSIISLELSENMQSDYSHGTVKYIAVLLQKVLYLSMVISANSVPSAGTPYHTVHDISGIIFKLITENHIVIVSIFRLVDVMTSYRYT